MLLHRLEAPEIGCKHLVLQFHQFFEREEVSCFVLILLFFFVLVLLFRDVIVELREGVD